MNPFATVLLPTYNSELHVEEAVSSILSQTFENFELLIIDDGSTDRTPEIVSSFNDRRLRLVRFIRNKGVSHALNHGLSLSTSRYIVRMDADDVSVAHRLATQLGYMEENADIGICGSHVMTFGDREYVFSYPTEHEHVKISLLSYNPIAHPSVVVRREALAGDVLRYRNRFKHCEDYDLWARCAQRCRIANIPEPLVRYRMHSCQVSHRCARAQSRNAARVRLRQAEILCDGLNDKERRAYTVLIEGRTMQVDDACREEAELLRKKLLRKNADKRMYDMALLQRALENPCQTPTILRIRKNGQD